MCVCEVFKWSSGLALAPKNIRLEFETTGNEKKSTVKKCSKKKK